MAVFSLCTTETYALFFLPYCIEFQAEFLDGYLCIIFEWECVGVEIAWIWGHTNLCFHWHLLTSDNIVQLSGVGEAVAQCNWPSALPEPCRRALGSSLSIPGERECAPIQHNPSATHSPRGSASGHTVQNLWPTEFSCSVYIMESWINLAWEIEQQQQQNHWNLLA